MDDWPMLVVVGLHPTQTPLSYNPTVHDHSASFVLCFVLHKSANYNTIQYNIRLLHRSQTATTSNMKQMNTKYNYLIVETKE